MQGKVIICQVFCTESLRGSVFAEVRKIGVMNKEIVLITGASSGIGKELAVCFAADGCDLVLVARRFDLLEKLSRSLCEKYSVVCTPIEKDLGLPDSPPQLYEECMRRGLEIDVLVNNAGFGLNDSFVRADIDRQLAMVKVNISALLHLTHLFLPQMIERRRGGVLNVGSTTAFQPGPFMAVYYASKAFVLSFTEALAAELTETPLTVSCLVPGPTESEFQQIAKMRGSSTLRMLGNKSAADVARVGFAGFRRGKKIILPGVMNRLGVLMTRLLPSSWILKIILSINKK
jgi:uncharacterized protein